MKKLDMNAPYNAADYKMRNQLPPQPTPKISEEDIFGEIIAPAFLIDWSNEDDPCYIMRVSEIKVAAKAISLLIK